MLGRHLCFAPLTSSVIVHGVAIVQILKPAAAKKTLQNMPLRFSSRTCLYTLSCNFTVHHWFGIDRYIEDSLKGTARAKCEKGVRRHVVGGGGGGGVIPGNWRDFLRVDRNKTELFHFLSKALLEVFNQQGKQLVITDGEYNLSKPSAA